MGVLDTGSLHGDRDQAEEHAQGEEDETEYEHPTVELGARAELVQRFSSAPEPDGRVEPEADGAENCDEDEIRRSEPGQRFHESGPRHVRRVATAIAGSGRARQRGLTSRA